jgi:hypothetical protein
MTHVIVRYRVKPEQAEHNAELVRAVYAELHRTGPAGLRYATYRLDDGVTFVHVSSSEGASPLPGVEAFQRFQAGIGERCDEPPVVTRAQQVGSFP